MRITRWAEYGVHILAFIAKQQELGDKSVGASRIAEAQGIARDYTLQILHRLREGGLLDSIRGPHGGFYLQRPAQEITLRDILVAAEGSTFEVICDSKPLTAIRCAPEASCGLRAVWFELQDHLNRFLDDKSLQDLVEALYAHEADQHLVQIRKDEGSVVDSVLEAPKV